MPDENLQLLVDDPVTGLPQALELSPASLREALIKNPTVLVGALRTVLERGFTPQQPSQMAVTSNTPISQLMSPGEFQGLSPSAKRLTRSDLMSLAGWGAFPKKNPSEYGLSIDDVKTLREVFGRQLAAEFVPQDVNVSCCCCSPCCCCAAAVIHPIKPVA